jgi:metal-responsive CopG/Arc/MetJ family transcriptional regulator
MKTAISVPDETFAQVEAHAAALGMNRSEFFTQAAQQYIRQLDDATLAGQIDAVVALLGPDDSAEAAVEVGRQRLADDGDDW